MKNKADIRKKTLKLTQKLYEYEDEYKKLSQIDLGSGEGNSLREEINKIKGALAAFKWILEK